MSNLFIVFIVSVSGAGILLTLKLFEVRSGKRLIFGTMRDRIDMFVETVPQTASRQIKLFLARVSLRVHEFAAWTHNVAGSIRRFFRQNTIRLFASARTQSVSTKAESVSPFLKDITAHKDDLTHR